MNKNFAFFEIGLLIYKTKPSKLYEINNNIKC